MRHVRIRLAMGAVAMGAACAAWIWAAAAFQDSVPEPGVGIGHGYRRDGDHICFGTRRIEAEGAHDLEDFAKAVGRPLRLCRNVDTGTFTALSEEYSKDKNKVYYKWISPGRFWVVELAEADPATFEVLDFSLARDARAVWRADIVVPGADPATAEVVNPHWVWKDRSRVYYQSVALAGADPASFRHLGQGYYRDDQHVFWCTHRLAEADPATFQTHGDVPYARDARHVWAGSRMLGKVDAGSFELLHNHVFKDAKRVFVGIEALEVLAADPVTFVKLCELDSGRGVLFQDSLRHYLYEPMYNEVYAIEVKQKAVLISKPVWFDADGKGGSEPVLAATVSTELVDGELSAPSITIESSSKDVHPPTWEKGKVQSMKPLFIEAAERIHQGPAGKSNH